MSLDAIRHDRTGEGGGGGGEKNVPRDDWFLMRVGW